MAVDGAGNLYIADQQNHRIRKVDLLGVITTIAGTGERGFAGDNGPATQAQLNFPAGVVVDSTGILYIADVSNHRIRKVDSTGTITTIAGTGTGGFGGDGGPATEGAAQLSPWRGGGGGGPRTSAPGAPRNLTVVAGNGEVVLSWDAPRKRRRCGRSTGSARAGFPAQPRPRRKRRKCLPWTLRISPTGRASFPKWCW